MESIRLAELIHNYEAELTALYYEFMVARADNDKKLQSVVIREFLKVVRSLNREVAKPVRSRKSMSSSRIPEWFSQDAVDILHDMWSAKAIDELAITLLKKLRKQSLGSNHAAISNEIEKTRKTLKTRIRTSKAEIMKIAPDFWKDTYEEDFKKYLTR